MSVVRGNSVMAPAVVIRPILSPTASVNHRFPSGPAVIPTGSLLAVGMGNSLNLGAGRGALNRGAARAGDAMVASRNETRRMGLPTPMSRRMAISDRLVGLDDVPAR